MDGLEHNPLIKPLGPQDAAVLDALLAQRAQRSDGARTLRFTGDVDESLTAGPRAQRMTALLSLLNQDTVGAAPADLTERTMASIAEARQRERFAQQVQALTAPAPAFRWTELIGVAAVLLVGVSLLWPMLAQTRNDARRLACQANMQTAGVALSSYAAENAGMFPRKPLAAGANWMTAGLDAHNTTAPAHSNSANVALLVNKGYATFNQLYCPANPYGNRTLSADMGDWHDAREVPWASANQFGVTVPMDRNPSAAALADRNPLYEVRADDPYTLRRRLQAALDASQTLHGRLGQNVLSNGGDVRWLTTPFLSGDNIWTLNNAPNPKGTEGPTTQSDNHVAP